MEQNENNGSKKDLPKDMLKYYADLSRAQTKAKEEAMRLGQPLPKFDYQSEVATPKVEEAKEKQSHEKSIEAGNEFLTSTEAAKILGYSLKGFRNAVSSGKIPHYKLFGQNRFKKSELLGLLVKVEVT